MRSSQRESFLGARSERESFSMMRNRYQSSTPSLNNSITSDRPEDLSDVELVKTYNALQTTSRQCSLENDVYKRFLERIQPDLLANVDQTIASIVAKELRMKNFANMIARPLGGGLGLHSSMSLATLSTRGSVMSFLPSTRGYTTPTVHTDTWSVHSLNILHKQEMVVREMEEIGRELESFRQRAVAKLSRRKAKAEQLQLDLGDVVVTRERFTEEVVVNGVEVLTQKIPAERFVRFMTESLKTTDTEVVHMRLKTNRLHAACKIVQQQLALKRELNESICSVDFAKIKISNEMQAKRISVTHDQLAELKELAALFKIRVSKVKNELSDLERDLVRLTESKRVISERIRRYQDKVEAIKHEVDRERSKLLRLQDRRKEFTVPDPLDYLKLKMNIFDLKKEIKTTTRKRSVLLATLVNTSRFLEKRERKTNRFPDKPTATVVKTSCLLLKKK